MSVVQEAPAAARFSVEGKSILITGATGALGSVAARALADAGARLTLAGAMPPGWTASASAAPRWWPGGPTPRPTRGRW